MQATGARCCAALVAGNTGVPCSSQDASLLLPLGRSKALLGQAQVGKCCGGVGFVTDCQWLQRLCAVGKNA